MKTKKTFIHTCTECGFVWHTWLDTGTTVCAKCVSKRSIKKFTVICISCLETRTVHRDPKTTKTSLCKRCSSSANGKNNRKLAPKVKKIYIRVCSICGDKKHVRSKKHAEVKFCSACSRSRRKKSTKPKKYSKETIEREIKKNREHKKSIADRKEKKVVKQKLSDEQLIRKYLKTNKVTVIQPLTDNQGLEVQIHGF